MYSPYQNVFKNTLRTILVSFDSLNYRTSSLKKQKVLCLFCIAVFNSIAEVSVTIFFSAENSKQLVGNGILNIYSLPWLIKRKIEEQSFTSNFKRHLKTTMRFTHLFRSFKKINES